MTEFTVKSVVVYHVDGEAVITEDTGVKHVVALDRLVHATMKGYPDIEKKVLDMYELGKYLERGYIILRISFDIPSKSTL